MATTARRAATNAALRKAASVDTFAEIEAASELKVWLPGAYGALDEVIAAALTVDPAGPEVTPEQRIAAVSTSLDEFCGELLSQLATAITGGAADGSVAKRGIFAGMFR